MRNSVKTFSKYWENDVLIILLICLIQLMAVNREPHHRMGRVIINKLNRQVRSHRPVRRPLLYCRIFCSRIERAVMGTYTLYKDKLNWPQLLPLHRFHNHLPIRVWVMWTPIIVRMMNNSNRWANMDTSMALNGIHVSLLSTSSQLRSFINQIKLYLVLCSFVQKTLKESALNLVFVWGKKA